MYTKCRMIKKRFHDFCYDSSIDIKDRAFILFSVAVLIALYVAIPCGLIMNEPLQATISTAVGAIAFSIYVFYSFRKNRIKRAKMVLSIIVVFFFLPGMFFTNGGPEGGAPVWLLLGTIYIAMILEGKFKQIMLLINTFVTCVCWTIGYYFPDTVITYTREGNYFDAVVGLFIVSVIMYVIIAFQGNLLSKEEVYRNSRRLFEQTALALVNAIDSKDTYTHGHSSRVAYYSRKLAEMNFKSPQECDEVYYAALLHDVGKIGVSEEIITKKGKLTPEEYEEMKNHPDYGSQILQSITEFPYLSIGACSHHERYDGKGYPHHLKGDDIPEIARIISVADAYDAMTSKRSYRDPIPQQIVREEIVKGTGTQFDPEYARIMLHLIDVDTEYEMCEREEAKELAGREELVIDEHKSEISEGILITKNITSIRMTVDPTNMIQGKSPAPSMVLFDSLDGRAHKTEKEIKDLNYFEYGEIWLNGMTECTGARKMQVKPVNKGTGDISKSNEYKIEAVKVKDHALIRIIGKTETAEVTVALPDSTRYMYIGLTGEHCRISDLKVDKSQKEVADDYIPRIAKEISYIDGPEGDVPNVQVDGYRTASSKSIEIKDGLKITFHTKELPTARLVWHCPFIAVFCADDGEVEGENYRELAFSRFDGEGWECDPDIKLVQSVKTSEAFNGWEAWKDFNRDGYDAKVTFEVEGNKITIITENGGISVRSKITYTDIDRKIYAAVTGDQVAITNIKFS